MRYAVSAILIAVLGAASLRAEPSKRILDAADRARTKVVVLKTARGNVRSSATGFLVRSGLVLTAGHAVTPTATVQAWVNGVPYRASVSAIHPENDLALLRLEAPPLFLKPVELAVQSGALTRGERSPVAALASRLLDEPEDF